VLLLRRAAHATFLLCCAVQRAVAPLTVVCWRKPDSQFVVFEQRPALPTNASRADGELVMLLLMTTNHNSSVSPTNS